MKFLWRYPLLTIIQYLRRQIKWTINQRHKLVVIYIYISQYHQSLLYTSLTNSAINWLWFTWKGLLLGMACHLTTYVLIRLIPANPCVRCTWPLSLMGTQYISIYFTVIGSNKTVLFTGYTIILCVLYWH